ncbi:MAG: twin-arginine translocase subunit TatC [Candidatus Omnitrophica bacterium]|nr:twin-arginine translocase subunit TatC [Candidatus Omnitrophota bacterium]
MPEQPFLEHLEELRRRLLFCLLVLILASCLVYSQMDRILAVLVEPVGQLVFLGPAEAFLARLKLAVLGGFILGVPVWTWQLWRFVLPGLRPSETRAIAGLLPATVLFFYMGAAFSYWIVLPVGLDFLLSFGSERVVPMISIGNYFGFVGLMALIFGFAFQMPLLLLASVRAGVLRLEQLLAARRYVILGSFVLGAVLTPPDVVTQVLMGGCLIALYEASLLLIRFTGGRIHEKPVEAVCRDD